MVLTTKRHVCTADSLVTLGDQRLEFKDSCKFLGTIVDNSLKFSNHIDHIVNKISRNTGILFKIRDSLPLSARLNFYYAFIFPYLSYNVIVWGSTYASYLNAIIVQQKRTIRTICNSRKLDHTTPLFRQLGILKFGDIYRFSVSVHMYRSLSEGKFKIDHQFNTRNHNLAATKFHRLTISQHAFSFQGPHIWNSLPEYIRTASTISLFKCKLKKFFLDQYV